MNHDNDDWKNYAYSKRPLHPKRPSFKSPSVRHRTEDQMQTVSKTPTRKVRHSRFVRDILAMLGLLGLAIVFLIGWTHLVHWFF